MDIVEMIVRRSLLCNRILRHWLRVKDAAGVVLDRRRCGVGTQRHTFCTVVILRTSNISHRSSQRQRLELTK